MPADDLYPRQQGHGDAMVPLSMSQPELATSFAPGMQVVARFDMKFPDVVIAQGATGQIISQKGDPPLVNWDNIGERPAAPSQLLPAAAPTNNKDNEEVFYPTDKAKKQSSTEKRKRTGEDVPVSPAVSIAKLEEMQAKKLQRAKSKSNGGGAEKDKVDESAILERLESVEAALREAGGSLDTGNEVGKGKGKSKGKPQKKGKGKKGRADVTV